MNTYRYKARSRSGQEVTGIVEAYGVPEAVEQIRESCDVVVDIRQVSRMGAKDFSFGSRKVKEDALAMFCSQFSIILSAGLPMVRTVNLIAEQTTHPVLRNILRETAEDVSAGHSLAQSLENRGPTLPSTLIETIRAGEESGSLEAAFAKLHRYYEKSSKVRGKVVSAMIYPALVLVVAVVVVAIIMVVAVPQFTHIFASTGGELPFITAVLIAASDFLVHNTIFLLAGVALLILAFKLYTATDKGRLQFARTLLRLPALGQVLLMQGAAQFANTLSTLLAAGLPLVRAITITGRVIGNYSLSLAVLSLVPALEEGRTLGDALRDVACFPRILVEMTAVGEETGALDSTLEVVGAYYDNEVEVASARAVSLLEPAITIVLALIVCVVLMAVYLPMFSMYSSL